MAKILNLEGVRRGDAHLDRAKRLNPNVTKRPVPIEAIVHGERVTYSVPEVAQMINKHPLTIRRAIASGELKASGGGKTHYRISRTDLEAWWRARGGGALLETGQSTLPREDTGENIDALLDATAAAARRAGYKTDEDVERLIAEVRAELGHDAPRRALCERNTGVSA
jgi:excisionase family DNA binding protein